MEDDYAIIEVVSLDAYTSYDADIDADIQRAINDDDIQNACTMWGMK